MFCCEKVILWDNELMMNKFALEAIDRTLCDIITKPNIYVGVITFAMCGDSRQVFLVVWKGLCPNIVATSIKEPCCWSRVQMCRLRQNIRVDNAERLADLGNRTFVDWPFVIGEDKLETIDDDHAGYPAFMIVRDNTLKWFINIIYRGFANVEKSARQNNFSYQAFLAAHNEAVTRNLPGGAEHDWRRGSWILEFIKVDVEEHTNIVPIEYLYRLEASKWSPHRLRLTIGTSIMFVETWTQQTDSAMELE